MEVRLSNLVTAKGVYIEFRELLSLNLTYRSDQ